MAVAGVREETFTPRYRTIEHAIRQRLSKLTPGAELPSDAELCEEFGVSRMTARHAMNRLIQEGLVYRIPGRGTFVGEAPTHRRANSLLSFSNEMRRQGRVPTSRVVGRALRTPTREEAVRLQLKQGEKVLWLKRIRLADGLPIALESARLHKRAAKAVLGADLHRESLHAVLVRAGCLPTRGRATIASEPATADDARWLRMRKGDPMLVERRIILDQEGRPLEFTESRYPADRYALDVDFVVEGGLSP
ncbi:MAG TPA: GntR family transcriptional regulator [Candidatus Dormibacteraeota bacterium]|jgi:GntR family transcriptional regulator|nr:GntR family transcriptional regulator [Candidatus Dormibacteraeota bacterium]HEX2681634.1 GntR family transcriptional regulator [Candidatus Dormibacteraeota bacterium]